MEQLNIQHGLNYCSSKYHTYHIYIHKLSTKVIEYCDHPSISNIKMLYSAVAILVLAAAEIVVAFNPVRIASIRPTSTFSLPVSISMDRSFDLDTEHLIDEEMVTDSASASALADRCMEEAERSV